MSFKCEICGKKIVAGNSYSHSHKGSKRVFKPNLQRQKIYLDGKKLTAYVCTTCLKTGKVLKAA